MLWDVYVFMRACVFIRAEDASDEATRERGSR